ncbi:hypothetical protein KVR01_000088 [Diaporthe batatas]|uniref:uncharacterized protein n=1 Tax=Diaporthe batatas TaxID=748121 RepID=UPI001D05B46C|nr:uncharacterized protein KVR01_000088 [Diaporthe batatas]KAG8169343.1 hypothetical protein KVR01_000088 [Diaporthe batatas]
MTADARIRRLSSTKDRAEDITFAVEIKSIIPLKPSKTNFPNAEMRPFVPHRPKESLQSMTESEIQIQRSTHESIATALQSLHGIKATTHHQIQEHRLERSDYWRTHWIVYKANSAVPEFVSYKDGDDERPIIDEDAAECNRYVWVPVELCSPKLCWKGRQEAAADIGSVCRTLQDGFNAVANHSTEVHVHVGRHDGRFYSLKSMKKLATVLWLAEPILRGLKDPNSRNFDHTFTWGFPWREHSRIALALQGRLPDGQTINDLATGPEDDFDTFLARANNARVTGDGAVGGGNGIGEADKLRFADEHRLALRAIWRASTHKELGRMLCGTEAKYRRLGFNFHALGGEDARARASPRTVEFRFLEGCIDEGVVAGWVHVCVALAKLAIDQVEDWEFYDMVVLLLAMPAEWSLDAKFLAMMRELGIAREAYEPLQDIVRRNYPPSDGVAADGDIGVII